MIQSLDCKLLKYKLAFVVFLWPWSVLRHYIKQCTQIISNCYMGTILFTYIHIYSIYRILKFLPVNVAESMFANYVNSWYIKNSKSRNMTMVELLKWLSHSSAYVNVIRKSNNSANNSSHGIPTKYCLDPWLCCSCKGKEFSTLFSGNI